MVVHKMGTHLGLSVLAFNWAGTLIQHKLLWGFQFPQIKASAVSFFQKTGRFPSAALCDVLFVCPYDSIFCVLLHCCEEQGKAIWCGRVGEVLQSTLCLGTLGMAARAGRDKIWIWLTHGAPALGWHQDLCSPSSEEAPGHPGDSLGISTIQPITAGVQGWGSCCCLPQHPSSYPGLDFLCWASPAPAAPSNHLCPYGSGGSGPWPAHSGFIAIVLSCSFVLDISMYSFKALRCVEVLLIFCWFSEHPLGCIQGGVCRFYVATIKETKLPLLR